MPFSCCIDSRYTPGSNTLSSIIDKYNVYGNLYAFSIQAMMGDMGWTDIYIKELLCMIRDIGTGL